MTLDNAGSVRRQYRDSSKFATRVDLHARYSTSPVGWTEWIAELLTLDGCSRVLEVGCGPGLLWRARQCPIPDGVRIVATDMSLGMVREAQDHLRSGPFAFGAVDAQALPFVDASFDAVIANHMLYHVPDLDTALAEFVRVLRPSGRLYATTNGRSHFKEVREVLGIEWRYVDMFGLDNAAERLDRYFTGVVVERHADALTVPETQPVVDYVRSMSSFWVLEPALEAELRAVVDGAIASDGVFRISKDGGLVIATRR